MKKKFIFSLLIFINNPCFSESISKTQQGCLSINQIIILEQLKSAIENQMAYGKEIIDYCFKIAPQEKSSKLILRYLEINAKNVENKKIKSHKLKKLLNYNFKDDVKSMFYVIKGDSIDVDSSKMTKVEKDEITKVFDDTISQTFEQTKVLAVKYFGDIAVGL